ITADFLGTSNFIPAHVKKSGQRAWDEMLVESPLGAFAAGRSVEWRGGMPALLFFRSEYVGLCGEHSPACIGKDERTGIIERTTFLGNSADVVIRCGEIALRVRAHPARAPAPGTSVCYTVAPESCIVFPAEGR